MTTSTLWTWLLLGFAACLALGGIAVIALALFRDRARGKRRCPRCWYDMSAARDLRCTECGREARSGRALLKTRRHWKRAMVGVVMVLAAGVAGAGQQVIEHGWMRATPGWGYIAAMPWLEPQSKGMKELAARVQDGELREWEYRYLVQQCVDELRTAQDSARKQELLELLANVQNGQSSAAMNMPYASWARAEDIDNEVVVNAMVSLIDDADESVRLTVIRNLKYYTMHARMAIPALLGHLDDDPTTPISERICMTAMSFGRSSSTVYFPLFATPIGQGTTLLSHKPWPSPELVRDLKACGTDVPGAVTILTSALESTNSADRAIAIWALSFLAPDDPEIAARILACRPGADLMVRQAIMDAIARMPPSEGAIAAIRDELRGSDPASVYALNAARVFGPAGHDLTDAIRPHMDTFWSQRLAVEAWIAVGGEQRVVLDVMVSQLRDSRNSSRPQALQTLATLRIRSTDSLVHIEPLLTATTSDPDIKLFAALAYARLGGSSELATQAMLDVVPKYENTTSTVFPSRRTVAYSRLFTVAQEGYLHAPTIAPWLSADDSERRLTAVRCLSESGSEGVPYLRKLRDLRKDADPETAEAADHAVRRIEWDTRYPEKAAKLREQRRR